jgi:hypothetical protein
MKPALRANAVNGSLMTLADHDNLNRYVAEQRAWREKARLADPLVRLWDGDYVYRGTVSGDRKLEFEFILNDVGSATIELPLDHHLAKWVMQYKGRAKRNVHVTIDQQGARWSGLMQWYRVVKDKYGDMFLEVVLRTTTSQPSTSSCGPTHFCARRCNSRSCGSSPAPQNFAYSQHSS